NINFYQDDVLVNDGQKLESSFLEFPLSLKYKGMRLNNSRPYIIGGLNFRYDLAGKKEYDDQQEIYLRLNRADLYYEAGAGIDIYLPYFKLTIEAKMSNGMRDILVHEPAPGYPQYANAIESMRSQIWVLSFHFE
nr:PorT family protein [Bacteroidales bacterium]